jgi:Domain of unknown function (DUF4440)
VKKFVVVCVLVLLGIAFAVARQNSNNEDAGRVLALENVWNHAIQEKDTKALDMLLANSLVSVDIDGSVQSKAEFLASIKAADYQPTQLPANTSRSRFTAMLRWSSVFSTSKVRIKESRSHTASASWILGLRPTVVGCVWPLPAI